MTAAASATFPHIPVLLAETVAALGPVDGGRYLDGTFGVGGYSRALLAAARCTVLAVDRDPDAVARARHLAGEYDDRLIVLEGRFSEMDALAGTAGIDAVDGVALDLGVSSPQLDEAGRGFSFRQDGPLDMRMEKTGPSAADIVNQTGERELADLIFTYGEERHARRIARAIVAARTTAAIRRTGELAGIVRRVVPAAPDKKGGRGIDPATRTFQALRIHVNRELDELDHGLDAAERLLSPGGRLAVVSFHSLEDRRVKGFLRSRSAGAARPSRHAPVPAAGPNTKQPTFKTVTGRPISPSDSEITVNPRARSARLRVGERTEAPAWTTREIA